MRLQFSGSRFECRRHSATRAAPTRPEVNEDRQTSAIYMPIKCDLIDIDRLPLEQRHSASAAIRLGGELRRRHAVDACADRANY